MKSYEASAQKIVQRIMEDEGDLDIDPKDATDHGQDDYWFQFDGDVNAWVYGGSWYNPAQEKIIHFPGIEYDKDIEPDDVEIPATMLAKLPPEQEDWRENHERDKIIQNYQYARAAFLNARKPRSFYEINHTESLRSFNRSWEQYQNQCPTGLDDETWEGMPDYTKIMELVRYFGVDQYGSEFKMSYKEAQALLGENNI